MIKEIIFDLGGVLVGVDYRCFLNRLANALHISTTELIAQSQNGAHQDYMKGLITAEQFVDSVRKQYNQPISMERFRDIWESMIMEQDDDVTRIVTQLSKRYPLSLLSNTDPWHFNYCKSNYPVVSMFKRYFLSYECHLLKPDPNFYKLVAHELAAEATECLFIDDLEENVNAAKEVGYQVIHFKDAGALQNSLAALEIRSSF